MPYQRPVPQSRLNKSERQELLQNYYEYYRTIAQQDPSALKVKIPRAEFAGFLDSVGDLLIKEAANAVKAGPVHSFLEDNPLPSALDDILSNEFRAFSLILNSLKQWVAAEQAAVDRYILGGKARVECRAAAATCVLSGAPLNEGSVELHHPMRDGRPPVPVIKSAHAVLEGQASAE